MRSLVRAGAVALLAASLVACTGDKDAGDPNRLVLSTFGFAADRFEQAVVKPFERETGIDVVVESGTSADRLNKLRINRNAPTVDVVLFPDLFAEIGKRQGLFEKVDPSALPNMARSFDFAKATDGYGPAYTYSLLGMIYRTDKVSAPTFDQLWAPKYAGQVSLPTLSASAGVPLLLGVANRYGSGPRDVDTAFTKLSQLKPNVLKFFSSSAEVVSLLDRGEVVMAPALDLFAVDPVKAGRPIAWTPLDGARYVLPNVAQIVKGTGNRAGAEKFINYLLSTEAQNAAAESFNDKPVNRDATVPEPIRKVVGQPRLDPAAIGFTRPDLAFAAEHNDEWVDRFTRDVSG